MTACKLTTYAGDAMRGQLHNRLFSNKMSSETPLPRTIKMEESGCAYLRQTGDEIKAQGIA